MVYNAAELAQLHGAGKAYKLPSGAILPTNTAQETATAITQAKNAQKLGGDEDDPGFRRHLIGRAAAHGLQTSVPSTWSSEQASAKSAPHHQPFGGGMNRLHPPDVSGLPPARRYAAQAERLADPVMARTYGDLAKSMTASHAQLLGFVRAGTGYQLADDTIVAGTNAAQVNAAVLSAKAAAGKGGPCDNAGFRRWIEMRCTALGLPVPVWSGVNGEGYAGDHPGSLSGGPGARPGAAQAAGARARNDPPLPPGRPAAIAPYDGRSGDAGKSAGPGVDLVIKVLSNGCVELETAPGPLEPTVAGEAYVKSQRYTGLAMKAIDPQTREMYLTAAREVRKAAGL